MIIKSDLKDLVIPPTMLSFITTNKCTAACRNCCFKCNPKNNERLSLEVIKKHIDTALSSFTSIKVLILTGGECFTLGDDLFSVIDYGAKKGLITRVVSNAYWAMTFKRTYNMISKLKQSGLSELNVSSRPLKSPFLRDIVPTQYLANFLKHATKSFHGSFEVIGRSRQKHVHSISNHTLIKVAA